MKASKGIAVGNSSTKWPTLGIFVDSIKTRSDDAIQMNWMSTSQETLWNLMGPIFHNLYMWHKLPCSHATAYPISKNPVMPLHPLGPADPAYSGQGRFGKGEGLERDAVSTSRRAGRCDLEESSPGLVGWLGSQAFGHLPKQICVEYQLICWYTYLISCSEIILGPTKNSLRIISSPRVTFDKSFERNFHLWWEAPYRWRHACLSKLQAYLVAERAAGRYHPLLSEGLDGP